MFPVDVSNQNVRSNERFSALIAFVGFVPGMDDSIVFVHRRTLAKPFATLLACVRQFSGVYSDVTGQVHFEPKRGAAKLAGVTRGGMLPHVFA